MQLTELVGQQWKPLNSEDSSLFGLIKLTSVVWMYFLASCCFWVGFLYIQFVGEENGLNLMVFVVWNSHVSHFISCT